jgi:hypothetical protein
LCAVLVIGDLIFQSHPATKQTARNLPFDGNQWDGPDYR